MSTTNDAWWAATPAGAVRVNTQANQQVKNPKYLKDGDVVAATVATDDATIDLGAQRTVVRYAR